MDINPRPQAPPGFEWISYVVIAMVTILVFASTWWFAARAVPIDGNARRATVHLGGAIAATSAAVVVGVAVARILNV